MAKTKLQKTTKQTKGDSSKHKEESPFKFKKGDELMVYYKNKEMFNVKVKQSVLINSLPCYWITFTDYKKISKQFPGGFIPNTNLKLVSENLLHIKIAELTK